MTRSPVPYSNSAISLGVPLIEPRIAAISRRVKTTGSLFGLAARTRSSIHATSSLSTSL